MKKRITNNVIKRIVAGVLISFIIGTEICPAEEHIANATFLEDEKYVISDEIESSTSYIDNDNAVEMSVVKTSLDQSAVITSAGDLYIWGEGAPKGATSPQLLMSDVKDISFGGGFPYVLKTDGNVWTWETKNEKTSAVKVMSDVTQVVSGYNMTAVIKSNGDLWTWGSNYSGQLGQGIEDVSWSAVSYAPKCILNNVKEVIIDADEHYGRVGAITAGGELYIWGEQVITGESITTPLKVMDDVTDYVMGYGLNVVLKNDGTVWTWGENEYGELGIGTTESIEKPVKVSLSDVKSIYYSDMDSVVLAITSSGELYVWGGYLSESEFVVVGSEVVVKKINSILTRRFTDSKKPKLMATNVQECAGACGTIFFVKKDYTLWGWGYPYDSLSDLGECDSYIYPEKIVNGIENITYATPDCCDVRFCVWAITKTDGSLWMWGNNSNGAIGTNSEYDYTSNFHEIIIPEIGLQGSEAYYSKTESRLFRVMDVNNTSYPSPAGFAVTVGSNTYKSGNTTAFGSDDIAASVPTGYNGNIKVSKSGYYDYIIPGKYTGQYNVVAMTPTTVTTPFVQTLLVDNSSVEYNSYRNVLADSVMMYQWDLENTGERNVEIYPSIEWCGHGAGIIWLEQGNITVSLTNNAINTIDWNAYYFSANQPIYLCAKAMDGNYFKVKTKINVYEKCDSGVTLDLGEQIEINMDESGQEELDLFAGQKIKFDLSEISDGKLPFSFSVKDDGTIEGVIGMQVYEGKESYGSYGDNANKTSNVYHQVKDVLSKLKSIKGNDKEIIKAKEIAKLEKDLRSKGVISSVNGSVGVGGDISVLGYFTGKLENGEVNFKECQIALNAEGSLSYTHNTLIMTVPVYLKAKLAAEVEWLIKMSYGNESFTVPEEAGEYVDVTLKGAFEGGPGWYGYLSAGAHSGANIKISNKLPMKDNNTVCSASADVSLVGTAGVLEGEWVIKKFDERIFWDGGWCWKTPKAETTSEMCFVPDLTVNEMQVMAETTEINGETVVQIEGDNAFVSGISGYSAPTALQMDDKLMVVWVADVEGRSAVDSKALYYSICENGIWTTPVLVSDDGTRDSTPELHEVGGTICVAWKNATQIYNMNEMPLSVSSNSVSGNSVDSDQISTVVSVYNQETNTWGIPLEDNPEWYLAEEQIPEDYEAELPSTYSARKVIATEDKEMILYTAPDETGVVQIYGLFKDENDWGEPIRLTDTGSNMLGFDAVYSDNVLKLLCATGEYSSAALSCVTVDVSNHLDIAIDYLTYNADTLVSGRDLIVNVFVKNNGTHTVDGFEVTVNGGESSYTETIYEQLVSGAEEIYDISFPLPDDLDFGDIAVTISALTGEEINVVDNTAECALNMTDISLEYTAANLIQNKTKVVAQVINRGHEEWEQETQLTIRKNASDGEVIRTITIPTLEVGEVYFIEEEFTELVAGDMLFAEVTGLESENLCANNSTEMVVVEMDTKKVDYVEVSVIEMVDESETECTHQYVYLQGKFLKNSKLDWATYQCSKCNETKTVYYRLKDVAVGDTFVVSNLKYKVTSNASNLPTVKLIKVMNKNIKKLVVPNSVKYKGVDFEVTTISNGLCKKFKKLKSVKIGNNVIAVPAQAFYKCKKLKTVDIEDGVTQIQTQAFYGCTSLKKVNIGYTKNIGKKAFYNCTKLPYVVLSNVTVIGESAFQGCNNLKKITIKSKMLKSVGKNALKGINKNCKIKVPKAKLKAYKKLLAKKGQAKTVKITK